MSQMNHFHRLIAVISVLMPSAAFYPCAAAAQDSAKIEARIDALQKVATDELSSDQDFIQAETDLQELWNQLLTTKEPAAGSKEAKVFDRIGELLIKVRARVPERYAGGGGRPSALPIPRYAENKLIGQVAVQLHKLQINLLTQLKADPNSKKANELLIAVVLGQEDLAWEAGWPFLDDEIKTYREAGGLTKEIYLSRRNRGVKQINEDLKADFDSVGRESSREFVIFSPPAEADRSNIKEQITKKRGEAGAAWQEGTKMFDDEFLKSLTQR